MPNQGACGHTRSWAKLRSLPAHPIKLAELETDDDAVNEKDVGFRQRKDLPGTISSADAQKCKGCHCGTGYAAYQQ